MCITWMHVPHMSTVLRGRANRDAKFRYGPENRIRVTQVTFAALNLLYPRSIKALSGVNSEDQDNDQVSQIFRPKGDCAECRAVDDGRSCHCRQQKCLERSNPECIAAQAADAW